MTTPDDKLRSKRVLITGGLGMIGSTIAIRLVRHGAQVTLLDACIEPVKDAVKVNIADIRDKEAMKWLVRDQDIIKAAGWKPVTDFQAGIRKTRDYYEANLRHY